MTILWPLTCPCPNLFYPDWSNGKLLSPALRLARILKYRFASLMGHPLTTQTPRLDQALFLSWKILRWKRHPKIFDGGRLSMLEENKEKGNTQSRAAKMKMIFGYSVYSCHQIPIWKRYPCLNPIERKRMDITCFIIYNSWVVVNIIGVWLWTYL